MLKDSTALSLGSLDSTFAAPCRLLPRCVRRKLTGLLTACTKAGLGQGASSFQWSLPAYSYVFRNPSPPIPQGWPLSWVKQIIQFPEDKLNELRGLDATVYLLFLRACSMSIFCFDTFKL